MLVGEHEVSNQEVFEVAKAAYEEAAVARGMTQAIFGEVLVQMGVPKEAVKRKLDRCLEAARMKAEASTEALLAELGVSRLTSPEESATVAVSPSTSTQARSEPAPTEEKAQEALEATALRSAASVPDGPPASASTVRLSPEPEDEDEIIRIGPFLR